MMWVYGIALLLAVAALLLYYGAKQPKAAEEEDGARMERCRRTAAMHNFWAYDGTEQTDAEELATQLFCKEKRRDV